MTAGLLIVLASSINGQVVPDRLRWSVPLPAPAEGAPVLAGPALVIPLQDGSLSAHIVRTGSRAWTAELGATQPLAADAEQVYVASDDAVVALAGGTGRTLWRVSTGGPVSAALLAHAGWVVAASGGDLLAIRATDGAIVWRQAVGPVEFRPALDGDLLVVSVTDGHVAAFNIVSGAMLWRINLGAPPTEPLAIGGRVYVGTDDKWFYALHASHGRRDWRWPGVLVRGRAAADDRHIYFTGMDNVLRALDRGRGALRWSQGLPYRPAAGPVVIGEGVIVPGYVDSLPVFRQRDGGRAGQVRFAAALTALPVFAAQEDGLPMVFATLGSLLDQWTVTRVDASRVPVLPMTPLKELPGQAVPAPQPATGAPGGAPSGTAPLPPLSDAARAAVQLRRMVNPVRKLIRRPAFDGTTATFTGTFITPVRIVTPAAKASATPTGVTLGPTPNSVPSRVLTPTSQLRLGRTTPCSVPPSRTTHSLSAATPFPFE